MAVDDGDKKLLEVFGVVFQQKGIMGTPKAFVESILNNVKTLDEALSEYQRKNGGEFVNRQIQLSYGKGALEHLLMFLCLRLPNTWNVDGRSASGGQLRCGRSVTDCWRPNVHIAEARYFSS